MKAISIRLDDRLGKEFDSLCRQAGYKKNTLLTRLIASFVRHQKSQGATSLRTKDDPFAKVIGLMAIGNLTDAETTIDQVVYDL